MFYVVAGYTTCSTAVVFVVVPFVLCNKSLAMIMTARVVDGEASVRGLMDPKSLNASLEHTSISREGSRPLMKLFRLL